MIMFEHRKYHSLYFDMNCIIHPICRRIMELNPDCSENDMFDEVMKEVVKIINHVEPENMVYLAVDGIAPMAKVIQQRYRRFRNMREKRMLQLNEKWNSNKENYHLLNYIVVCWQKML